jgi:hypothetical protein
MTMQSNRKTPFLRSKRQDEEGQPVKNHILLCVSTYNAGVHMGLLPAMVGCTEKHTTTLMMLQSSASCHGFNQMYAMALNGRKDPGYTHFVLIHHDIEPEIGWIDKMVDVMNRVNADFLQVVIPIKDLNGLTSTALDECPPGEGWDPRWTVRRLTMKEVYRLPPTFSFANLLVNNGLIMIDLRAPWVEKVQFKMETDLLFRNGRFEPVMFSEDWYFAREANKHGAKIYATREIRANHHGVAAYGNAEPWGELETDNPMSPADQARQYEESIKADLARRSQPSSNGLPGTAV